MNTPAPQPSSRFVRAATSEREDLLRHRRRLADKREGLLDQVRQLDTALAEIDQRLLMLRGLLGAPEQSVEQKSDHRGTSDSEPVKPTALAPAGRTIRGPAIREAAVKVLLDQPEYVEALHYRRWHELLRDAGYVVSGKDSAAVFLTQLTRSPVVRKGTEAGVYELDRQAPLRLRQRLERLRAELRELTTAPASDAEIATLRARRHELDVAISRQERALEEALRVLRRDDDEPRRSSVAG